MKIGGYIFGGSVLLAVILNSCPIYLSYVKLRVRLSVYLRFHVQPYQDKPMMSCDSWSKCVQINKELVYIYIRPLIMMSDIETDHSPKQLNLY